MANSTDKTHQTNEQHLSYSWLGTGIFKCRKWWIEAGFIALNLSIVWQSNQISLYLQRCVNKTEPIGKIVKTAVIPVSQSQ